MTRPTGVSGAAIAVLERLGRVGADPLDDDDLRARKALLVQISVLILPVAAIWGALYLAFGSPVGWVPFAYFAILLGAIVLFSRTRAFSQLLRIGQVDILFAPTLSMIPLGGFLAAGGVGIWGILAPLAALVFSDVRDAARWYIAFVVVFLASGLLGEALGPIPPPIPRWFTTTMLALNITVAGAIVFTLLAMFVKQRRDALAALRAEQAKAEDLLLNILPSSIAERLKAQAQPIADQIGSASILFADVVDFTPLSERLPADEVVGILDHLFSHFDTLAERYGSRRSRPSAIATWSPRACRRRVPITPRRWPTWRSTCSRRCARATRSGDLGLELRIGINSGPVVAGVIGRKRFLYDLWGDAVNTASRMESHGTPGRIQVTRATADVLEPDFVLEKRGTIPVKGKGDVEVWYVTGRRPRPGPAPRPEPTRERGPTTSRSSEGRWWREGRWEGRGRDGAPATAWGGRSRWRRCGAAPGWPASTSARTGSTRPRASRPTPIACRSIAWTSPTPRRSPRCPARSSRVTVRSTG